LNDVKGVLWTQLSWLTTLGFGNQNDAILLFAFTRDAKV